MGIVLLSTTPNSASVTSALVCRRTTRLHYETQIKVIVMMMWLFGFCVTQETLEHDKTDYINSEIEEKIFTASFLESIDSIDDQIFFCRQQYTVRNKITADYEIEIKKGKKLSKLWATVDSQYLKVVFQGLDIGHCLGY